MEEDKNDEIHLTRKIIKKDGKGCITFTDKRKQQAEVD